MGKQNNDNINIISREETFYLYLKDYCKFVKNKKVCNKLVANIYYLGQKLKKLFQKYV